MGWQMQRRIQLAYARELKSLTGQFFRHTKNMDDPYEMVKILEHISRNQTFKRQCENVAYKMVTMVKQENLKSWREAAAKGSRGREIYNALMAQIKNSTIGIDIERQIQINAGYIQTLPTNIAFEITEFIESETYKGVRASEMVQYIETVFPKKTKANASLIARTEVSKTQCALTQARAENLGIKWYIWRTSKDSRVRSSHDIMDGVLIHWSNPPSPEKLNKEKRGYGYYHAGNIFNCRCYAEPVIDVAYIQFPCKVYINGTIKSMTKAEFLRIA